MARCCVVHLVRRANGVAPLERFIGSYRANAAGASHDLLLVFKGFASSEGSLSRLPPPFRTALDGVDFLSAFIPDVGLDIGPYFQMVREHDFDWFCFLNSFSVILAENWLGALYRHASRPGVGLAGATGSHESPYSHFLDALRDPQRAPVTRLTAGLERRLPIRWPAALSRQLIDDPLNRRKLARYAARFAPYPNPHIRTNAFFISRRAACQLRVPGIRTKWDAHAFEGGRRGMTCQVLAAGLGALVVGRDGRAYEPQRWYESRTFRSGAQENLLVADNQTEAFARACLDERRFMTSNAWGVMSGDSGAALAGPVAQRNAPGQSTAGGNVS